MASRLAFNLKIIKRSSRNRILFQQKCCLQTNNNSHSTTTNSSATAASPSIDGTNFHRSISTDSELDDHPSALFPWIVSTEQRIRAPVIGSKEWIRYNITKYFVWSELLEYSKDIHEAMPIVFDASCRSIFTKINCSTTTTDTGTVTGTTATDDIASTAGMEYIFENNLKEFYQNAINKMLKSKHSLEHKLVSVDKIEIVNYDFIPLICRSHQKLRRYCKRKDLFSVMPALDLTDLVHECVERSSGLQGVKKKLDELNWNFDRVTNYSTCRVLVDVHCKEIFCIKDNITGSIMQGKDGVAVESIHQILLEAAIDRSNNGHFTYDWVVIDIDNFLNGNDFLQYRL